MTTNFGKWSEVTLSGLLGSLLLGLLGLLLGNLDAIMRLVPLAEGRRVNLKKREKPQLDKNLIAV